MKHKQTHYLTSIAALLSVLLLVVIVQNSPSTFGSNLASLNAGSDQLHSAPRSAMAGNIAKRLRSRLLRSKLSAPSESALTEAVLERQQLLKAHTVVQFHGLSDEPLGSIDVSVAAMPLFVRPNFTMTNASFVLDANQVASYVQHMDIPGAAAEVHAALSGIEYKDNVPYAVTDGVAQSGQDANRELLAEKITQALATDTASIDVSLEEQIGSITNTTDKDLGPLELLASGRSNFYGSDYGRISNVRKALRHHVNNVMVPPGETFSFNATLGNVTLGNGWAMAKVIFNETELRPAPGGGICQASTTTYRAILNAGLPVVERRSHSLYVSYYKAFGVGIDATVFPGVQDLTFLNDTGNYLLIQAYDDGFDATVNIYGTPDGRRVSLDGPYFTENAPDDLLVNGRNVARNEIVWMQNITKATGEVIENQIVSRYHALPLSIRKEFAYSEQ